METAINIDVDILNKAMQFAGEQSQRQLVENALKLYVLQNKQHELYKFIQDGIDDVNDGRTLTEEQVIKNMEQALGK